jgi:hypothetical protein
MNSPLPEWSRLVAAARRAPRNTRDESAPYGFATRVAAQAMAGRGHFLDASLLSRYGLRALGISCVLAVACAEEAAALGETPVQVEVTEIS